MRYLQARLQCPKEVVDQGLPAIKQFFEMQSKKYGYPIKPSYRAINHAGYAALNKKDISSAINIFEDNVKNYPYKADVYDSFADALEANGELKKALAMRNFTIEKSINENVENNAYKTRRDNLLALIKEKDAHNDEGDFKGKTAKNVKQ